jgi:hypothetical protein
MVFMDGSTHLKLTKTVWVSFAVSANLDMNPSKTREMCFKVFHKLLISLARGKTAQEIC